MNMCHFTQRALGGLAAQAWKIECLGLMILKMIESRLEMASPARPTRGDGNVPQSYLPGLAPTCPPTTLHQHRGPCMHREDLESLSHQQQLRQYVWEGDTPVSGSKEEILNLTDF